jgi:hypothetical protein
MFSHLPWYEADTGAYALLLNMITRANKDNHCERLSIQSVREIQQGSYCSAIYKCSEKTAYVCMVQRNVICSNVQYGGALILS